MRIPLGLRAAAGAAREGAWDLSKAVLDTTYSYFGSFTGSDSLVFKSDGTAMYMSSGDEVAQFTLSTPWDIDTASYTTKERFTSESNIRGIFFKPTGDIFYLVGTNQDRVYQYSLSSPWQITSVSLVKSRSISASDTGPHELFFSDDGSLMYIAGQQGDDVTTFQVTTPWDVGTSSSISTQSLTTNPTSFYISPNGEYMYFGSAFSNLVWWGTLSTPWDPTTFTYSSGQLSVTNPNGIWFKPDGTRMFVANDSNKWIESFTFTP